MRGRGRALLAAVTAAAALGGPGLATAATSTPATRAGAGTADLGLDLLARLGSGRANAVLSPDSVATAVAMAGVGARGTTAAQIAGVLHLRSAGDLPAVGTLQARLRAEIARGGVGAPQLDVADGLFTATGFAPLPDYAARLRTRFAATAQAVDFASDAGRDAVNAFVSGHTHGRIAQILGSVDPSTRLVLADALFLKARWADPFDTGDTTPASFHAGATTQRVPTMRETATLPYASAAAAQAVALPYADSGLALVLVVPRPGRAVGAVADALAGGGLERLAAQLRPRRVDVSLPRFRLHLMATLNAPLQALGMRRAFTDRADLSGVAAGGGLKLGVVAHAADVAVDEAGTVAAAATAVTVEPTAVAAPQPTTRVAADHPFLFFLRDRATGAVLFAGRLADAAAAPGPAPAGR